MFMLNLTAESVLSVVLENDGFGCDSEPFFLVCYFLGFDCS